MQKSGPGAAAGLEPGDVILKFNGEAIARSSDLPPEGPALKPGATVKLEVWRDGKAKTLTATDRRARKREDRDGRPSRTRSQGKLGVVVRPLSPEEQRESKLAGGVVVEDVGGRRGEGRRAPGDVIVSVNRTRSRTRRS